MAEHADSDLGLNLPIAGVQLIEASAGTGKTFTVATLYSRLVIEAGLPVSAILAVTFTEAATKELRAGLRARLLLALGLLETLPGDADADADADALAAAAADGEETRLSKCLLRTALAREAAPSLRRRLRLACEQMDLAPIHTIHAFCRRALADHALEAGQPPLARELLQNETALRREVALEFWRQRSRDAADAPVLASVWGSPDALADSLRDLLAIDCLLPAPVADDGRSRAALVAARERMAAAFHRHGGQARLQLRQACTEGSVNQGVVKDAAVDPVWQALDAWSLAPLARDPDTDKLGNYASSRLRAKTNKQGVTPPSPLFDAIDDWLACRIDDERVERGRCIALVHAARDFALARLAALKRERRLLGFDDMIRDVADALEGAQGEAFATALQAQYQVALLDEFQDTDPRQWAIFRRLFAQPAVEAPAPRALFLIGDPKQAIYRFRGGDVFTYLAAQREADARHPLGRNFRSRPRMLDGVQAVFEQGGADAFAQAGIAFEPVRPGGQCRDEHLTLGGAMAPALHLQVLAVVEKEAIEDTRERATTACVDAIHGLLREGLLGHARLRDRDGVERAVAPGDIAVLVEKNADAERIHAALSRAGIPSVAAGRCSLFQTAEAEQLCWLFEALLAPGDDQRLRAALAAPLFGLDAAALAAFDSDEAGHRLWQDRLLHWQERAQRHGPLALLGELCAAQAPRLLALPDGERRLSNYLQLAEELQAADAQALGLAGVLAELERRIADADVNNEGELLRLETDSARVRIMTLHLSKGLTFELVFLPYAATNGAERPASCPPMARYHDGQRRVAVLYPEKDGADCGQEAAEERAEKLRLLYVGLTRARLATWVVWGAARNAAKTPLAWLLHRAAGATEVGGLDAITIDADLERLRQRAPQAISVEAASSARSWPRLAFGSQAEPPPAAMAQRVLARDWWVHSFSQLSREDGVIEGAAADDETAGWPDPVASRFSGTRFGNALHLALEDVLPTRWLDWSGALPPPGELEALAGALRAHGYGSAADQEEGLPLLTGLVAETLNARLPEGVRLAALPDAARLNEMEFHLALAPTAMPALLDLLHRFGIVAERQGFGLRQRLEGLLTGRIDLVYVHDGRYYLLDYKSNRLRDYGADALRAAVRDSEYDLQYVLYSLALHRWLRFRLGAAYDIGRHLGGVRYLFCRGLDRQRGDDDGIHALTLPVALVEGLDRLLQGERT